MSGQQRLNVKESQLVGTCHLLVLSCVQLAPKSARTSHMPQSCVPPGVGQDSSLLKALQTS